MTPANTTDADGTTLYYGDLNARRVLQVSIELRDRACHRMAESLLGTIRQVADESEFVVKFPFAGTTDDAVGGSGSQRGPSALATAHMAAILRPAGGIPAYGNPRSEWGAGCLPDFGNPEHR